MNDPKQRILPQEDGVIHLSVGNCGVISQSTFKVDKLMEAIKLHLGNREQWLNEGYQCEMLAPGGIWQKGRIRLQLEFHPEQPDTLFDERQEAQANEHD